MIFNYWLCDCLKELIKFLKACSKLLKANLVQTDFKTQCFYKKEISYEAVSSSKFNTEDVQIDIFSNFWLNFTEFHIIFDGSSTKKQNLQMILLKSKEKMIGNVCAGDQF